jgi:hypothetical protein
MGHPCEQGCFHATCDCDRSSPWAGTLPRGRRLRHAISGSSCRLSVSRVIMSHQLCVRPPSDTDGSTLCLQLRRGLRRQSPLTISSSRAVWNATNDPRHPRVGPVVGKIAAWGCPHHLQTVRACHQENGNIIAPGPPPSHFGFLSFFSLHSLCCMTGLSLGVIKGKAQYLSGK